MNAQEGFFSPPIMKVKICKFFNPSPSVGWGLMFIQLLGLCFMWSLQSSSTPWAGWKLYVLPSTPYEVIKAECQISTVCQKLAEN